MATRTAYKRLTREYKNIQESPPPYIVAHPTEANILEWVYVITGPPNTPYHGGQYWGQLVFPSDYPFKPPAIRMMTPSGRFQCSTRLCLSISDFHPKSFNPTWEVSTILIGLLSFMTSEEMTTGSMAATEQQRKQLAFLSRWWNSTGGGLPPGGGNGLVGAGDGGLRFRTDWPELDKENWEWMRKNCINPRTGKVIPRSLPDADGEGGSSGSNSNTNKQEGAKAVVAAPAAAALVLRESSWLKRNKVWVIAGIVLIYAAIGRILFGTMD